MDDETRMNTTNEASEVLEDNNDIIEASEPAVMPEDNNGTEAAETANSVEEDAVEAAEDSAEAEEAPAEDLPLPDMAPQTDAEAKSPAEEPTAAPAAAQQAIPILTEEKNPELEPVVVHRTPYQYGRSAERERKIASEIRKRKRRPIIVVMILSVLVIICALIVSAVQGSKVQKTGFENIGAHPVEIVTPAPGAIAAPTPTPEPAVEVTPEPIREHSYRIYVEDVTWVVAAEKCRQAGGYLVVIDSAEEFKKVTDLATAYNVNNVWVGCHRVDDMLVWEAEPGEDGYYYVWDEGEPSYFDGGDRATENYLLLWNRFGRTDWCYNDSRLDPAGEFPEMYAGNICYVCEFETLPEG
ncbi:MAG: C-type lectin domain-containing protein [Oscillospiraceae bacterium]|nr:C-type lectin domain-containing protein [Oscillospiraceae bacterium]